MGEDPRGKETKDRADEKWKQWAARESEKVGEAEKSASAQEKKPDETQNKSNDSGARAPELMDLGGVEGKAADIPVPQHEHDEEDLKETPQYKLGEAASSGDQAGAQKEFPSTGIEPTKDAKETGARAPVTSVSGPGNRKETTDNSREARRRVQVQGQKRERVEIEKEAEKKDDYRRRRRR